MPKRDYIALHRLTLILFVVIAAGRLIYIEACATPLRANALGAMAMAVPPLLIGSYYTFVQFRALLAIIFNCIALAIIGLIGADASTAGGIFRSLINSSWQPTAFWASIGKPC